MAREVNVKTFITYGNSLFFKRARLAVFCATVFGRFDNCIRYCEDDIDSEFRQQHHAILKCERGGGYWLWKPYIIKKTLAEMSKGDYLFYSDAGAIVLRNIDVLINELAFYEQDVMAFELTYPENQWTKEELFHNMDARSDQFRQSKQILSSFVLIRKSPESEKFISKWLEYSCNEINITDKPDPRVQQDKVFEAHRHDQSF